MTTVYEDLGLPSGATPYPVEVRVRLAGAGGRPAMGKVVSTGEKIVGEELLRNGEGIDSSGMWSLELPGNADIQPEGTTWYVRRQVGCHVYVSYLSVPVTGGPFEAFTLEDDPLGTITPSALSAHASDLDLHGGGTTLDVKYVTTGGVVTGSGGGLFLAEIPGTTVTVPDLARPIDLWGRYVAKQQSGGPTEHAWAIVPQGIGGGVFFAIDSGSPAGLGTATARMGFLWGQLPAHSAGNYCLAASGASGNLTAAYDPSALQKLSLRAVAA